MVTLVLVERFLHMKLSIYKRVSYPDAIVPLEDGKIYTREDYVRSKQRKKHSAKYDEDPLFHGPVPTMSSCQDGKHVQVLRLFHPGIA